MMENKKRKPLDMLHGSIWNKLPLFALPMAATAILEQLFNASDIAVVGNFTGTGKTIAVAAAENLGSGGKLYMNLKSDNCLILFHALLPPSSGVPKSPLAFSYAWAARRIFFSIKHSPII